MVVPRHSRVHATWHDMPCGNAHPMGDGRTDILVHLGCEMERPNFQEQKGCHEDVMNLSVRSDIGEVDFGGLSRVFGLLSPLYSSRARRSRWGRKHNGILYGGGGACFVVIPVFFKNIFIRWLYVCRISFLWWIFVFFSYYKCFMPFSVLWMKVNMLSHKN